MSWRKEADEIHRRREQARQQGGVEAVELQHAKGRLSIRERIAMLVGDSFREIGATAGSSEYDENGRLQAFTPANYILGTGRLGQQRIVVGGEDFTLKGGSPNPAGLRKSVYAEELAQHYRIPLVRLLEGGGGSVTGSGNQRERAAPVGEPVFSKPRFLSIAQILSEIPVASAALGPVAGFPAARLAASHFSVMTRETAQVMIAGPAVVKRALDSNLTKEELGGHRVHSRSGVVHNIAVDEEDAMRQLQRFLSYLPPNVWALPNATLCHDDSNRCEDALVDMVPQERRKVYDMRKLIAAVMDSGSFFEMRRNYGRSQITGFAHLNGHPVGIFANDCKFYAGAMTADGGQKARQFIDLCGTFHLPIVALVDEPGFMIGADAERTATIRHGAAAIAAAMQSPVPWASVIIRKVFGVAGAAHFSPDGLTLAWPSAESGALPVEGGVAVAFHREIAAAKDPDAKRRELEELLAARQSPFPRAESFAYHELIDPRETRPRLCAWMEDVEPLLESLKGPVYFGFRP